MALSRNLMTSQQRDGRPSFWERPSRVLPDPKVPGAGVHNRPARARDCQRAEQVEHLRFSTRWSPADGPMILLAIDVIVWPTASCAGLVIKHHPRFSSRRGLIFSWMGPFILPWEGASLHAARLNLSATPRRRPRSARGFRSFREAIRADPDGLWHVCHTSHLFP